MSKVFTLYSEAAAEDWRSSTQHLSPTEIDKIPNPDGEKSKKEPTSIPSPFARLDLFRTAFKFVTSKEQSNQLKGDTIYHKLISACFDVGEMFFRMDSIADKVKIITWDKEVDLKKLTESNNTGHKLYGETLKLFLEQDKKANNFDLMKRLYILVYDHKVIGGTSPVTLFFTSANDLTFTDITFGDDTLFDNKPKALFERSPEFQRFIYHYFYSSDFSTKMPDVSAYLRLNLDSLEKSNKILRDEIIAIDGKENNLTKLNELFTDSDTGIRGNNIEILGAPLKKEKSEGIPEEIERTSDFVIKSSKVKGRKPLVLQNNFSTGLTYFNNFLWDGKTSVPYSDNKELKERTLPGQRIKYPYLTISDFLEPYLIRLVYPINKEKFYGGDVTYEAKAKENKSFLLPIKKEFFDYFNTSYFL